jgi:hypothetical protein
MPSIADADEMSDRAGKIRSALVYYLTKFVTYPPDDPEHGQGSIKICLFGQDPINNVLPGVIKNKTAQGRALEIEDFNISEPTDKSIQECEVQFFGSEIKAVGLKALKSASKGVLTVCSTQKVTWGSCMVQIFEEGNKAKLAVDIGLLQAGDLKVSSELLEVSLVRKPGAE